MCPCGSSAQAAVTRIPVRIAPGPGASTACSIGTSAPSSRTSANANGRSNGCPATGEPTQVQETTVPAGPTSTRSVVGAWVTGSYSRGGTATRPSDPRDPRMVRSRSPVMNLESTGPSERV